MTILSRQQVEELVMRKTGLKVAIAEPMPVIVTTVPLSELGVIGAIVVTKKLDGTYAGYGVPFGVDYGFDRDVA